MKHVDPVESCVAVILAAGQGKRMRSTIPKVLHPLCGQPMLEHVLQATEDAGISRHIVVIGHGQDEVQQALGKRAEYVVQPERLGTAHAVRMAEDHLRDFDGDVLICCGDTPLLRPETLSRLIKHRRASGASAIVLTAELHDPTGYGRVLRDSLGRVLRIVEQKDCKPEEAAIREVNTGVYCVEGAALFDAVHRVNNKNAQHEYYLTDIVPILSDDGHKVEGIRMEDPSEMVGVNSRRQLAYATSIMRQRIVEELMDDGVTVVDPNTTIVHRSVTVGRDSIIHPFSTLKGDTRIGEHCEIGPSTHLCDATLGSNVRAIQSTVSNSGVEDGVYIGPHTVVRDNSKIGAGTQIAGLVDLANCTIAPGTIIRPLNYLERCSVTGDALIGAGMVANGPRGTHIETELNTPRSEQELTEHSK